MNNLVTNCDFAPKLLSILKGILLLSAPEQPSVDNGGLVAFGERLRRERLSQGVELEALARQLFMRIEQIEALENANLEQWPEIILCQPFPMISNRMVRSLVRIVPDQIDRSCQAAKLFSHSLVFHTIRVGEDHFICLPS
ncbi:MAG: hypothetical protein EBX33_07325 [Synechococcaceae bacterium WB8_1A_041]|nr:hypothetical protein [Synechococcaceae bacterium WB8_1A_041]